MWYTFKRKKYYKNILDIRVKNYTFPIYILIKNVV